MNLAKMKVDPSDLDKPTLSQRLKVEYGLDVETLTFVPAGEESHSYIAGTATGTKYFVKLYGAGRLPDLEEKCRAVHLLHTRCDLEYVVQPYEIGPRSLY
jgi:hypothetical protein